MARKDQNSTLKQAAFKASNRTIRGQVFGQQNGDGRTNSPSLGPVGSDQPGKDLAKTLYSIDLYADGSNPASVRAAVLSAKQALEFDAQRSIVLEIENGPVDLGDFIGLIDGGRKGKGSRTARNQEVIFKLKGIGATPVAATISAAGDAYMLAVRSGVRSRVELDNVDLSISGGGNAGLCRKTDLSSTVELYVSGNSSLSITPGTGVGAVLVVDSTTAGQQETTDSIITQTCAGDLIGRISLNPGMISKGAGAIAKSGAALSASEALDILACTIDATFDLNGAATIKAHKLNLVADHTAAVNIESPIANIELNGDGVAPSTSTLALGVVSNYKLNSALANVYTANLIGGGVSPIQINTSIVQGACESVFTDSANITQANIGDGATQRHRANALINQQNLEGTEVSDGATTTVFTNVLNTAGAGAQVPANGGTDVNTATQPVAVNLVQRF